ncbi:DUF3558 domain-containing protein [Amycolatopsis sacchari]|uniref:DUF3558 domain-containing protein n=1 Tax=Amycolatopsis sacchari TaxID=115433 RepID=UPI003D75377C
MRLPARSARPRLFVPVLLGVLLTTACGGPDLSKQNFPRTTVTASAAPDSPIADPAVSLAALRTVDPCALLDSSTLADVGTPRGDGPDSSSLGECTVELTDVGGKNVRLDLKLDDITINPGAATGTVEGLPLLVRGPDGKSCSVTAVTSRSPGYGVNLDVSYQGGDPCGAGQLALRNVVRRLHSSPAKLSKPAGSLIDVDFCTILDEATITNVLGRGSDPTPYGMHGCSWNGGVATGYLDYDEKRVPAVGEGETQVDLGGGLTGVQELRSGSGRTCSIDWLHRPTADGEGEVVSFEYNNFHDDAANDDACGKALTVVKALLPKLPRA